jgi:Zn-dependent protease with chaperone function
LRVGGRLQPRPLGEEPLLGVDSVAVPAFLSGPHTRQSILRKAAIAIVELFGVPLFAAGALAGLVVADVASYDAASPWDSTPLIIATVLVAATFIGVVAALVGPPTARPHEVELPEESEPELWAEIDELARRVGTRGPDRIVLCANATGYVTEARGERTLGIGAPLLDVLEVSEMRALLAHELGHFASGGMRLGPITRRAQAAVARLALASRSRLLGLLLLAYLRFERRIGVIAFRAHESMADHAGARVAGRQTMADALRKCEVAAAATHVFWDEYVLPLVAEGFRPDDLVGGWRALAADGARQAELVAWARRVGELDDRLAIHPPTSARLRGLAAVDESQAVSPDRRLSRLLLRDPERWTHAAYERLLAELSGGATLHVVAWEDWPQHAGPAVIRERAAAIDTALEKLGLEPGLVGLRAALVDGRRAELVSELLAAGWGGHDMTLIIGAAVRSVTESGAARWVVSWSKAWEVRTSEGHDAFLLMLPHVKAATAGEWQPLLDLTAGVVGWPIPPPPPPPPPAPVLGPLPPPSPKERAMAAFRWLCRRPIVLWMVMSGVGIALIGSVRGLVILVGNLT